MKHKIVVTALTALATIGITFVSCSKDNEGYEERDARLSISVNTAEMPKTKALIEETTLPEGSKIGVSLKNLDGGDYDDGQYNNNEWTASGTGGAQTWISTSDILLSATKGKAYAYYPYNSSVTSMDAVPVTTSSQVDYMYAKPTAGICYGENTAQLTMNHALAAVRLSIRKGNYTGECNVTSISVKSNAVATDATLNAETGKLSNISGKNTAISLPQNFAAGNTARNVDVIVVPSGESSKITFTLTIDNKEYDCEEAPITLQKGNIYCYTLTINDSSLSVSGVAIDNWNYTNTGDMFIDLGWRVSVKGETSGIAFSNTVSDGTLIMKAVPVEYGRRIAKVSTAGDAEIKQSVDKVTGVLTIEVVNLKSNVTLTFNGFDSWQDITEDGIYYVAENGSIVFSASTSCIGIVLVANGHKFMIEKNEDKNKSYTAAGTDKISSSYFYWGEYDTDQSDIPNYTNAHSSSGWGYIPDEDGNYGGDPKIPGDLSTWVGNYALADWEGKANSEVLKKVTSGGGSNTSNATIGQVLNTFLASSDAKGYEEWYIPSCGQLALMYRNMNKINTALADIGGQMLASDIYWASSEDSSKKGWYVNFNGGVMGSYDKNNGYRVRFIRDL